MNLYGLGIFFVVVGFVLWFVIVEAKEKKKEKAQNPQESKKQNKQSEVAKK
jgi:large-conductance mechanosensitive channel